jgi:hypothetical protein
MLRVLPLVIAVVLTIYCLVEVVQSDATQVRTLPRWGWLLMVFLPIAGPLAWLLLGRPTGSPDARPRPARRTHRPPPDDDADFLRQLRVQPPTEDEFRSWEDELRRRDEGDDKNT